jgi:hypothetical protein
MPVDHVLPKAIIGGEVKATAEPPDGLGVGSGSDKKTDIGVGGGHVGVGRVNDYGDA